uniref:Intimal thickness related receptor IRP domain-containing protein n=1 Tax=Noctiluca scintillans TaxID=2966 RepID=A0A7S0ZQI0_NOCSC|mmetsp:Transcript_14503/g.39751  ORF Transcript_14503/g.39751 Transcript_14503/m.39751 type:complete len:468 (+) Transcript_14503:109-1512(+)
MPSFRITVGELWLRCAALSMCGGVSGLELRWPSVRIEKDLTLVLLESVWLAPGATLSLNFTVHETSCAAVVLLTKQQSELWQTAVEAARDLESHPFQENCFWRAPLCNQLVADVLIDAPFPSLYNIAFVKTDGDVQILEGGLKYVNPLSGHLDYQLVNVPEVLWISSMAFLFLMGIIVFMLTLVCARRSTMMHTLLVVCLWLKTVSLVLQWNYVETLARYGFAPKWRLQYGMFVGKLHEIGEMVLLLMLALGWRVLRLRLTSLECRFTVLVVGSTLILAILEVICIPADDVPDSLVSVAVQTGEASFNLIFYGVRLLCWLVTFFAGTFNLRLIRLNLEDERLTPTAASLYLKHRAYNHFLNVFIVTVVRIVFLSFLQSSFVAPWVVEALKQASSWVIYSMVFAILIFVRLRPVDVEPRISELVLLCRGQEFRTNLGGFPIDDQARVELGIDSSEVSQGYIALPGENQ